MLAVTVCLPHCTNLLLDFKTMLRYNLSEIRLQHVVSARDTSRNFGAETSLNVSAIPISQSRVFIYSFGGTQGFQNVISTIYSRLSAET